MTTEEITRLEYLDALSKSSVLQYLEWLKCKNDLYHFLTNWAITEDAHWQSKGYSGPFNPFPEKEYIKLFTEEWLKYNLLFIPKSRQVMISWLCVGAYLWDTQFHKSRFTAFQSKKEADADELVKRLKVIWDNEPFFLKRYYDKDGNFIELQANPTNKGKNLFCRFELPAINSRILGVPQGGDVLRGFTFTGVFSDETAFQPEMDSAYTTLKPTLSSGGRLTAVSTAQDDTFFADCVFDRLKMN